MLKTYSGMFASDGDKTINVPEIWRKQSKTMIEAYYSLSGAPNDYIKMTDGWLDIISHIFSVSWDLGTVTLLGMNSGDRYLIYIYSITTSATIKPIGIFNNKLGI